MEDLNHLMKEKPVNFAAERNVLKGNEPNPYRSVTSRQGSRESWGLLVLLLEDNSLTDVGCSGKSSHCPWSSAGLTV